MAGKTKTSKKSPVDKLIDEVIKDSGLSQVGQAEAPEKIELNPSDPRMAHPVVTPFTTALAKPRAFVDPETARAFERVVDMIGKQGERVHKETEASLKKYNDMIGDEEMIDKNLLNKIMEAVILNDPSLKEKFADPVPDDTIVPEPDIVRKDRIFENGMNLDTVKKVVAAKEARLKAPWCFESGSPSDSEVKRLVVQILAILYPSLNRYSDSDTQMEVHKGQIATALDIALKTITG